MANYLCEESRTVDDVDTVAQYIYGMTQQAKKRGFDKPYLKSKLYNVMTHTTYSGDSEATVSISAKRRTAINPVYALVTKLFHIGETRPFDETLNIVKQDGSMEGLRFALVPAPGCLI